MRLLLMTPFLTVGGADRLNLDIIRQLADRGFWCSVVATLPHTHEWRPLFEAITPDVVTLYPTIVPEQQPAFVRDLIRSRGIQALLISNSQVGYTLLPYLRYHCSDVVVLDLLHAVEPHWLDGGYPRLSLRQRSWIDLSIAVSADLRDWMIARGGDPNHIVVCPAAIDVNVWNPDHFDRATIRQALGIPDNLPLILFIGRLATEKRPRLAAQILRGVAQCGVPFFALIIGDGPERPVLERMLRDPVLRNVRLTGALLPEQVRQVLAVGDILLLPSEREGIAVALYEAMAMGVVPVAADIGGQRELVTSDCGILIPPSDHETPAYVEALIWLLTDPDRRVMMGSRARQRIIDHFRLDLMGDRISALIRHAVNRSAHVARAIPAPEEAAQSAIEATHLARRARDVARLWQKNGYQGEPHLPVTRRAVLRLMRSARKHLRPWYRRFAARDDSRLRRSVLTVRDWVAQWVYREPGTENRETIQKRPAGP
ncbi:MAG: glycosyltransferase family 4 protein [Roseiflexus sp.]